MKKSNLLVGVVIVGTAFVSACAQDSGTKANGGSGGSTTASSGGSRTGGSTTSSGGSGSGGTTTSGGTTASGGSSSGSGGTSASGGSSNSGGTSSNGGVARSGGSPATGGNSGNGGGSGTGGMSATGGASPAGGGSGTGGRTGAGGGSGTGGAGTGGGSGTGGAGTGGTSATGGGSGTGGTTSTGGLPALSVVNGKLQANGKTVVLRGSSLIDVGALYAYGGNSVAGISARMDKVAAAGVQGHVVRMPVYPKIDYNSGYPYCSPLPYPVGTGPSAGCTPTSPMTAADYVSKVLKPAVDYATSKNLYVIIDHHQIDDAVSGTSATATANDATTFWADVAPKFAGYANVIFEPFNEPINGSASWATFKPIVQGWIDTIRKGALNNVIIVPSMSYDQHPGDAASDPPTGGNFMFTAHVYPGNWNAGFKQQVATAASKAPVFITEWGYDQNPSDTVGGTTSATWGTDFEALVDGNGASWTAWVTDNGWTPSMFSDSALATLTPFGTVVKNWLAAKATSDWVQ